MKNKPFLVFNYALSGIGFGIPITLICMTLLGGYREPIGELAIWTVASALMGLLSGAIFYEGNYALPTAFALHCTGCLVTAVIAAYLCGYETSLLNILISVLPIFLIVYVIVYGICYFFIKLEEKRVNDALKDHTD